MSLSWHFMCDTQKGISIHVKQFISQRRRNIFSMHYNHEKSKWFSEIHRYLSTHAPKYHMFYEQFITNSYNLLPNVNNFRHTNIITKSRIEHQHKMSMSTCFSSAGVQGYFVMTHTHLEKQQWFSRSATLMMKYWITRDWLWFWYILFVSWYVCML